MKQLNCGEVPKNENWRKETQTSWAQFWVYIWGSSKTFRMFIIVFFSNFSYLCMIDLSQYKYHYLSTSLDSIIISNFINLTHSIDVKFFDIYDRHVTHDWPFLLCNAVACPHLERSGMGTACSRSASAHLYHADSRLTPCDGAVVC